MISYFFNKQKKNYINSFTGSTCLACATHTSMVQIAAFGFDQKTFWMGFKVASANPILTKYKTPDSQKNKNKNKKVQYSSIT